MMMRWPRFITCALIACAAAACETDLVDDSGFQLWCGERLCAWTLEEGDIDKVSTWHDHDYGVDLVGSPVVLSQEGRTVADCMRVETVSEIATTAEVFVGVDGLGDGAVDWVIRVPPSEGFQSRAFELAIDVSRESVYFIRKSGAGRAVLARVRISDDCVGNTDLRPRATNGATPNCDASVTDDSIGVRLPRDVTAFEMRPTSWNSSVSEIRPTSACPGLRGPRARM